MSKDDLGDRMKEYERLETSRKFLPFIPVYARIDGKCFSKLTRACHRPWDSGITDAMIETTKYLVNETHALIGYTQSDEISLLWLAEDRRSEIYFTGKIMKMASVLSSMAAVKFKEETKNHPVLGDRLAAFDCRVFQLPNKSEATNAMLWRYMDAKKNSVSMLCRSMYSAKQMHGKNQIEMIQMIADKGMDYYNVEERLRTGSFARRVTREEMIDPNTVPPQAHARIDFSKPVLRSSVIDFTIPNFHRARNREGIVFEGQEPLFEGVDITV
tara:strand:- start:1245 stop:2057 length:813 start_codon:yes stop_codon:yes gene_type:complete